jgi:hypothetical protein
MPYRMRRVHRPAGELLHSVPGRTAGLYPVRGTSPTVAKAMCHFASPPQDYDRHDIARQKRLVAEAFAGWAGRSPGCWRHVGGARLLLRLLPYMPWRGLLAGGVQKAANAITVADYQR